MEKVHSQPALELDPALLSKHHLDETAEWRLKLPTLVGSRVTLRELRAADAPDLFTALTAVPVVQAISPPPSSVEGFERFIAWTHRQRDCGQHACFAIVPSGSDRSIGIFQVRSLESSFATAEWGCAIAREFWGSGVFVDGARMVIDFALDVLGVHRLEARAAIRNGRGTGALRKIGAVQEAVLRRSFLKNGEYLDQILWTIVREDWRRPRPVPPDGLVH